MITKQRYETLKNQHEEACKTNNYSKMIMMGSKESKQMREYEAEYICKHASIQSLQGGQIEKCTKCGKTW